MMAASNSLASAFRRGESIERELLVTPSQSFYDGPSLAKGEVTVAFVESERGAISDSDSATITRHREATQIVLLNPLGEMAIRPNGTDTVTLSLMAFDDSGLPVADDTPINLATDRGTIAANGDSGFGITGYTKDGKIAVIFTTDTASGIANVSAELGGASDSAVVYMSEPGVHTIVLEASPTDLSTNQNASALVATLRDVWGDPVPNVSVRIGVSDDSGTQGKIDGAEVVTGTTDSNGQLSATFAKTANAAGKVNVRAEYFVEDAGNIKVVE